MAKNVMQLATRLISLKDETPVLVDDGERLYRQVAGVYYDEAYDALIIDCADTRVEELKKPREIPRG